MEFRGINFEVPGHSTLKIEGEETVYVDPWSRVMNEAPQDADIVVVTHDDFDHYDTEGIDAVSNPDTRTLLYEKIDGSDLSQEYETVGMKETKTLDGVKIRTYPSYNFEDGNHVDDDGKPFHAEGEVVGVLIEMGGLRTLFTSDTDALDHYRDVEADVLVLPIGGHFTMNADQASDLAIDVDPELGIPVHYDTFEAIEADEKEFRQKLEERGIRVELLKE